MQQDTEKLIEFYSDSPSDISLEDIDLDALPHHISFIMDGNGRWAQARGLDRTKGHQAGVDSLREIITTCVRLGIDEVSAYAFSTENWKRPQYEVNMLMKLFGTTLLKELPLFKAENVRLKFLGDLSALPANVQEIFQRGLDETAHHTGMTLALAVNYGSRAEMVRAARNIALELAAGEISEDQIDDDMFESHLYTADMHDPELLIRTSGEFRLSNFLLWQCAYTEFYITDTYWPDFDRYGVLRAIASYQHRDRRFGGVK